MQLTTPISWSAHAHAPNIVIIFKSVVFIMCLRWYVIGVVASVGLMWWQQWQQGDAHGGGEKERDDMSVFEPALLDLGSGRLRCQHW